MSTLLVKQWLLAKLVGQLITWAYANGFTLKIAEAYRTPEQAALYAASGKGIAKSLHCSYLAIDLPAFKDGKYLTKSEDYKPLGDYWLSLHPDCRWGGNFVGRPDGNHFSITYEGRA